MSASIGLLPECARIAVFIEFVLSLCNADRSEGADLVFGGGCHLSW